MESQPQNPEFRNNPENFNMQMLYSIYHMTLKLLKNCIFGLKTLIAIFYTMLLWTSFQMVTKSINH